MPYCGSIFLFPVSAMTSDLHYYICTCRSSQSLSLVVIYSSNSTFTSIHSFHSFHIDFATGFLCCLFTFPASLFPASFFSHDLLPTPFTSHTIYFSYHFPLSFFSHYFPQTPTPLDNFNAETLLLILLLLLPLLQRV